MLSSLPHHHLQASHSHLKPHSHSSSVSASHRISPSRWLLFFVLFVIAGSSWYWLHYHVDTHHEISASSRAKYLSPPLSFSPSSTGNTVDCSVEHSIIYPAQYARIRRYLLALQNSVSIVTLPETKSLQKAIQDCEQQRRPSLFAAQHQHSAEIHFPWLLQHMQAIGQHEKTGNLLRFLHDTNSADSSKEPVSSELQRPLFYFTQSYFYTVVYCTYKAQDKEDWKAGLNYWKEIADPLLQSAAWWRNRGLDHVVVASHPKSGPQALDPYSINAFARQSFLRTDFDVSGYNTKDVIIPYYVASMSWEKIEQLRADSRLSRPEAYLLVFIGSDNPRHGIRSQLSTALQATKRTDIFVSINNNFAAEDYVQYLLQAEFCLSLRGDTASSSRLFAILDVGCIPVIISDWIVLPFESFLDYSKFSIRFSESILEDVPGLLSFLSSLSEEDKQQLRNGVLEARSMLLYHDATPSNSLSLLNPVSLTLMDLLRQREDFCHQLQDRDSNDMCVHLAQRLDYADRSLQELPRNVVNQGEDDPHRQKKVL